MGDFVQIEDDEIFDEVSAFVEQKMAEEMNMQKAKEVYNTLISTDTRYLSLA